MDLNLNRYDLNLRGCESEYACMDLNLDQNLNQIWIYMALNLNMDLKLNLNLKSGSESEHEYGSVCCSELPIAEHECKPFRNE